MVWLLELTGRAGKRDPTHVVSTECHAVHVDASEAKSRELSSVCSVNMPVSQNKQAMGLEHQNVTDTTCFPSSVFFPITPFFFPTTLSLT